MEYGVDGLQVAWGKDRGGETLRRRRAFIPQGPGQQREWATHVVRWMYPS